MKVEPKPPAGLSAEAKRFWRSIVREYEVTDSGGLRLLQVACESLDLQRKAEAVVEQEGMTYRDRYGGLKPHPMLATVRDSRHAFLTALRHLSLDVEPLRDIGRPPGVR